MNKDKKMLFGIGIAFLFLATVSLSYAYFTATITNKDVKDQIVTTGTLQLTYTDGPEIVMNNIKPGATITKEVSVKNTGTLNTSYNLVWQELANEIINDEMVIEATCTRYNGDTVEGTCESLTSAPIKRIKIKENVSIEPNIIHKYNITITFKETNADQNYNQGKSFTGVLGINEYVENTPIYCTFDGDMVQGAEYVNGQYTYKYKQEAFGRSWRNMSYDGWGVQLTDGESTDPVTTKLCTYINNKPIVSMASMFHTSNPVSIDFSSFNTTNVKDMSTMFVDNTTKTLDLSNFNTSNVTDMSNMFCSSQVSAIDVSDFDTSKVTDMYGMFESTQAKSIIGLENFNTSNVESMNSMFYESNLKELNLDNFDTSKVTNMTYMFYYVNLNELNLSSFNTSNVTDMFGVFQGARINILIGLKNFDTSKVTDMGSMFNNFSTNKLDLSNFDTSNVTNMDLIFTSVKTQEIVFGDKFNTSKRTHLYNWFFKANIEKLDLSNFDTSNVTSMRNMFWDAKIGELNISNLNTSAVTDMYKMFSGLETKKLNLSSFDTSNVIDMSDMFSSSEIETIYGLENFNTSNVTNMSNMFIWSEFITLDLSSFDTSKVTNMDFMFNGSTSLKTIYVSSKFVTTAVTTSTSMFGNLPKLVGGNGTKYNVSYIDKTYARIDRGTSSPGYFTLKNN